MSRAFVKESDGADGEELPELQVSPHRNLVTPSGLQRIEATVGLLQVALSRARADADRAQIARIQRDLRYWSERQHTAEVIPAAESADVVRFGCAVTLEKPDGVTVEYRIVGEDEADPARGSISYVSPIARFLIGRVQGDVVALPDGEATILEIS
ncbi:MAG TPA: transcription elongation factor GreA [Steroidobacteraceae bacterium]|nr:transcription elongation factor GreA [Steroidobacteraceae bacterium]